MTGIERLHVLAEALKAPMPENFGWYFGHFFMKHEETFMEPLGLPPCGACGCALGLAGMLPQFNAEGFHIDDEELPRFGICRNFAAAAVFFEISLQDVEYLFGSASYGKRADQVTPSEVAQRIDMYLIRRAIGIRVVETMKP